MAKTKEIEYVVEYGRLFEVNAAAFRKKWETAYPREEVLQLKEEDSRTLEG
ncbi:hypothetical protein PQX77_006606 [Marasmius sp. AFHP31]|nr:hypothetical protein PQX77_006606 [Marasmius sp. AFHP31]